MRMGRSSCCDAAGLKRGPWTPEEDHKLLAYIKQHGIACWRSLPHKAGLKRCGKSCRLRWTNYLRPDIKRGNFSFQEEQTIIQLHALLGNRWSSIATFLPNRTDNEIKNHWNTHLKKRLAKMGIDSVTHKPMRACTFGDSKNEANLRHMAQWETTRLEAEARMVRELKLSQHQPPSSLGSTYWDPNFNQMDTVPAVAPPLCFDISKAWQGDGRSVNNSVFDIHRNESSTIMLSFLENSLVGIPAGSGLCEFTGFLSSFGGDQSVEACTIYAAAPRYDV